MSFQQLFMESKGQPIQYKGKELKMVDRINLSSSKIFLRIEILSTNSIWKQGIILQTKGHFEVNKQKLSNKIIIWEDTAPKQIDISITSKDKILLIYNAWKTEDGTTHYWHNGGALFTESDSNNVVVYYCNDGYADDDFDDIIFKLEYL